MLMCFIVTTLFVIYVLNCNNIVCNLASSFKTYYQTCGHAREKNPPIVIQMFDICRMNGNCKAQIFHIVGMGVHASSLFTKL